MALLLLIIVLVNLTSVQNYIVGRATKILSERLNTHVSIQHIRIDPLNKLLLQGVYIEGQEKDTLLYAGEVQVRITDWFILRNGTPVLEYIGLQDAYATLYRKKESDQWNYQFIVDAFAVEDDSPKEPQSFNIDLEKVDLENVRFHMNDAWVGSDMNFDVGSFSIDANNIDLEKKLINLNTIDAVATRVVLRDYDGGRPPKPKDTTAPVIDTTAFNPDNWKISVSRIDLEDCYFSFDAGTRTPYPNEFDPAHIRISEIQVDIDDVQISGDTLLATLNNLSAQDRSGLIVKKLKADVRVSPTESICKDLTLITNNSELHNYYAMHYSRFPDFLDYINKVKMVAHLQNSKVDANDIAFFAPQLRQYPTVIKLSGDASGTVSNIEAKRLYVSDGYTTIKGNLKMDGLPDINNTYIDYTNGELLTSGNGIIKYAPELKDLSTVDLNAISNAYFKGDFKGYINDFIINGTIASNLGTIVSDVNMIIAETDNSKTVFNGKVKVDALQLGTLLRTPDLGSVTLNADVKGTQSKQDGTSVDFNTIIDQFGYKGYNYQNINADGKLEKQKFTGNLLIADPNVAMGFYGLFDFSEDQLKINAKANLLQSNLSNLKLVDDDSVTLTADFDLDWEGKDIDNFTGYAKLYNIDLTRNGHLLDLDSVYVNATEHGASKEISIYSNAFSAVMNGEYQLSSLPASFQYYVAGYLPNYIKAPDTLVPNQNIRFSIRTNDLDSLFGIFAPSVSGFNQSEIKGYLNTTQQKLELNAALPKGKVQDFTFINTTVDAHGDFRSLNVNLDMGSVVFPDTSMKGSLKLNTTLGNDKLSFKVTTFSPYTVGDAVIQGNAYAHGDTLDASILPSEFFLSKSKWEIAGGNKIVYTDGYLSIENLNIKSGEQSVVVQSANHGLQQVINTKISNVSAEVIGNVAGLSNFELAGLINGNISVTNPFTDIFISSDIKGTNVKFGADTVGNVIVGGTYDGKKHLVNLNPQTGIYRKDKSINVAGRISFDDAHSEKLDGVITMSHTPLSWLSPLLVGFVSDIDGTLDGKINIGGSSSSPDIDGRVELHKVGMHIDFLGTRYTIPTGVVNINNKLIDLGSIKIHDQYNDNALLTGGLKHNHFSDIALNLLITSEKFEVINLKSNESELFYGNLVAKFESLSIQGPFDDVKVRINKAEPAQKSHLYLPISTGTNDVGAYSFISFKTDEDTAIVVKKKNTNKLSIHIEAIMNPLAEITMIMDPSTGDAISASGSGNISLDIPPSNDIRMYGRYIIEKGSYNFTLPQLFFKRNFVLNTGSVIQFEGPIDNTQLNVGGIYKTRARLYDLLNDTEKEIIENLGSRELSIAKVMSDIDVILQMKGSLGTPELSFRIEMPDKSGAGTIAYKKLERVNQDDQKLFSQVASLLLVNTFMSDDGGIEGGAGAGVVNNVSDIFSGTASSQLTNLLSKLTGDEDIAVNLKYQKYSFNDNEGSRNALSLNLKKNLLKDRLTIEVGSSLDWGKPTANGNTSSFNPVGDFRLQYLIKEGSNLRGNIFRTSSYDVLDDRDITRGGVGLSWRKSFNNLGEFFGGSKYIRKQQELNEKNRMPDSTRVQ